MTNQTIREEPARVGASPTWLQPPSPPGPVPTGDGASSMPGFGPDRRLGGRRGADPYRGPDRRRALTHDRASPLPGISWLVVVVGCGLTAGMVGLAASLAPSVADPLAGIVRPGAPVVACIAAVLMFSRWRRNGETRSAVLALVAVLLFGVHPVLTEVVMPIRPGLSLLVWLDTSVVVVSFLALAAEIRNPPIETSRHLSRLVLIVIGAVALVTVLLQGTFGHTDWPGLGVWGQSAGQQRLAPAVLAALALVLGGLLIGRAPSKSVQIDRWFGLALVPWGWSELLSAAYLGHRAADVTALVLRLAGMVVLAWGAIDALAQETARQRTALFASQLSALAAEAERRALEEARRSRSHDVRSVLLAVQTAGFALQERIARLSEEDRRLLTEILGNGVRELDRYLTVTPEVTGDIPVSELVAWVHRRARDRDIGLEVDVPEGLQVVSSASLVRDVLSVMVDAASGPCGSTLRLEASSEEGGVRLCLGPGHAQGGPPQAAAESQPTGARDGHASAGLEVLVAAEVARRAGGRLDHASTPDGRVSLSLLLPAPTPFGADVDPSQPAQTGSGRLGADRRRLGSAVRSSA